jgi:hypothetical protein
MKVELPVEYDAYQTGPICLDIRKNMLWVRSSKDVVLKDGQTKSILFTHYIKYKSTKDRK